MVKSTLAANNGDKSDPEVQIGIADNTRSQDGNIVTDVLENASTEAEEESAITKIAGEVQTDDDKMRKVNKMINEE